MVSEKAEEILGVDAEGSSKDEIAVAFWLKTEEIDRRIIDTDDEAALDRLLEEKDQLLEARAQLEGVSIQQIRRSFWKKEKNPAASIRDF